MAKMVTPAMERHNRKNAHQSRRDKRSTPTSEALKRFKRNKLAIFGMIVIAIFLLAAIFADIVAP